MNKNIMLLFVSFVFLFVGLSVSHAQSNYNLTPSINSTVIITTGINSIDSFSAYPLANMKGIPIISINGTQISQSLVDNLTAEGVKTAIVLGGPVVISNSTISMLEAGGINVIRIWGMTAPDTAIQTVEYFMPKPVVDCAVFAYYNETPSFGYPYQFTASLLAAKNRCIMFPTYFDNVPLSMLSYLQKYNITNVTFVGPTNLSQSVFANLSDIHLRNILGNQTYMENATYSFKNIKPERMLIVGVNQAAWNASLVLGSLPMSNSSIVLVSNVSKQMPPIINEIKTDNITDVTVVGIPSIAALIEKNLSSAGINSTSYSGIGEGFMKNVMGHFRNRIYSDGKYYAKQFDVVINSSMIREMINEIIQRFDYYNSTLYGMSIQSDINISGAYSAMKPAFSFILDANTSLNAGNITAAMKYMQQAQSQMNGGLYYSNVRGAFVSDSVASNKYTVAQDSAGLMNATNAEILQLNGTLASWTQFPIYGVYRPAIYTNLSFMNNTIAQMHTCAYEHNLTCIQSEGFKIKTDMQNTVSNMMHIKAILIKSKPITRS